MEMSEFTVDIKMHKYLAQWLAHEMGGEPIELPRGSCESKILQVYMTRPPQGQSTEVSQDNMATVKVYIPDNKIKDPMYYHYLPKDAQRLFVKCVRDRFTIKLFKDLRSIGNIGVERKDLIVAWMRSNGIEYTGSNWDLIEKAYLRAQNSYRQANHRLKKNRK